jgi:hypothetical protein
VDKRRRTHHAAADQLLVRIVTEALKLMRRRGIISSDVWKTPEVSRPDDQPTLETMRVPLPSTQPKTSLHSGSASVHCAFSLHCASRALALLLWFALVKGVKDSRLPTRLHNVLVGRRNRRDAG